MRSAESVQGDAINSPLPGYFINFRKLMQCSGYLPFRIFSV